MEVIFRFAQNEQFVIDAPNLQCLKLEHLIAIQTGGEDVRKLSIPLKRFCHPNVVTSTIN